MYETRLSRTNFETGLAQALRHYARPDRLVGNPLLDSRLISTGISVDTDPLEQVAVLRSLLAQQVDALAAAPKTVIYRDVLAATYLCPATSQPAAARSLGLAYGSYRRYLTDARKLLSARLWMAELDQSERILMQKVSGN